MQSKPILSFDTWKENDRRLIDVRKDDFSTNQNRKRSFIILDDSYIQLDVRLNSFS